MKEKLFDAEGPVFGFLDKLGKLIVLSAMWLIGCIPVITIFTSNAALYYAVRKSVRMEEGSAVRNFLKSYKINFLPGCAITAIVSALVILMMWLTALLQSSMLPNSALLMGFVFVVFIILYIGPVLSRFNIGIIRAIKLAFVASLQYAHFSILFLLALAVLVFLQFYVLPIAFIFVVPGVWTWASTFLMEKVLSRYISAND